MSSVKDCTLSHFPRISNDNGNLSIVDHHHMPFDVARIFYVTNPRDVRGKHAHKALFQYIIAISGKMTVLIDDGEEKQHIEMLDNNHGLLIPPMIWSEQSGFSDDCAYIVLASDKYDEDDYIRNYEEFLTLKIEHDCTVS